jgi:hypothetical protein
MAERGLSIAHTTIMRWIDDLHRDREGVERAYRGGGRGYTEIALQIVPGQEHATEIGAGSGAPSRDASSKDLASVS